METTKTNNDHVLITPPDRYWSEAYNVLLIDFEWGLAENIINPLRSSDVDLAIHVFTPHDTETEWLLNVAEYCNIVLMDMNQTTNNDVIKGHFISKRNTWYTGREDLKSFWPRHTNDPLAVLLVEIDRYQRQRGNQ